MLRREDDAGRFGRALDEARDGRVPAIALAGGEHVMANRCDDRVESERNQGKNRHALSPSCPFAEADNQGSGADADSRPAWEEETQKPPGVERDVDAVHGPDDDGDRGEQKGGASGVVRRPDHARRRGQGKHPGNRQRRLRFDQPSAVPSEIGRDVRHR